jgi:hypothetical protein
MRVCLPCCYHPHRSTSVACGDREARGREFGVARTRGRALATARLHAPIQPPPPPRRCVQLPLAAAAFLDARAVVVLTGFPCRMSDAPPTESDGPPGAVALVTAALALGKAAALATDTSSAGVLHRCAAAAGLAGQPQFALYSFPPRGEWGADDTARLAGVTCLYDHAVAIERAGQAADGSYYTMRALRMDHLVAPIDELLTAGCACGGGEGGAVVQVGSTPSPLRAVPAAVGDAAAAARTSAGGAVTSPGGLRAGSGSSWGSGTSPASPLRLLVPITRSSTGIGDGGNEAGMGCVVEAVRAHIPRGDTIACVTPADHLITAGVSNWGGWGLVAAVEAVLRQRVADGEVAAPLPDAWAALVARPPGCLLPDEASERALAEAMVAAGARDGITGALDGSVDGLPLDTHLAVLGELRGALLEAFGSVGR